MVDIPSLYPSPAVRPNDAVQPRPQEREQQPQEFKQPNQPLSQTAQSAPGQAPLNVLPSDEALDRLVSRAQEAQTAGQTLQRGSILNLVI